MTEIFIFTVGAIFGGLGLYLFFQKIKIQQDQIKTENEKLSIENQKLQKEKQSFTEERAMLKTQNEHLRTDINKQEQNYEEKLQDKEKIWEEKYNIQKKLYEELEEKSKQLMEKTKSEFQNIASKIFQENSKTHQEESRKNLSLLLNPFKTDMENFKKSIHGFTNKETTFEKTIENFKDINKHMRDQTIKLTQALKGDIKTQAGWGEEMLESILEKSGLRNGEDFFIQAEALNLKNKEGLSLRPDAVVKLPENKFIIIDSKVSYLHYSNYLENKDEESLEKFLNSVNSHIENLSSKEYHFAENINASGFTLMFIPNEGMFALATQNKKGLFEKAWRKSIILVSPSTLYATLKTVASLWKIEKQNKNAEKIAKRGQLLYEKFVNFLEDMKKIDLGLKTARDSYDQALDKLQNGRGNLLTQSQTLQKLESKNQKKHLNTKSQEEKTKKDQGLIQDMKDIEEWGVKPKKTIPSHFEDGDGT